MPFVPAGSSRTCRWLERNDLEHLAIMHWQRVFRRHRTVQDFTLGLPGPPDQMQMPHHKSESTESTLVAEQFRQFSSWQEWLSTGDLFVLFVNFAQAYRWITVSPNMDKSKSRLILSHLEIKIVISHVLNRQSELDLRAICSFLFLPRATHCVVSRRPLGLQKRLVQCLLCDIFLRKFAAQTGICILQTWTIATKLEGFSNKGRTWFGASRLNNVSTPAVNSWTHPANYQTLWTTNWPRTWGHLLHLGCLEVWIRVQATLSITLWHSRLITGIRAGLNRCLTMKGSDWPLGHVLVQISREITSPAERNVTITMAAQRECCWRFSTPVFPHFFPRVILHSYITQHHKQESHSEVWCETSPDWVICIWSRVQ